VRREELHSPSSSRQSSPDLELAQLFRDHVKQNYEIISVPQDHSEQKIIPEDEDEEVEFRLFAPSSKSDTATITKFRLRSPATEDRPPGLVNPERPRNYYFRDSLSPVAEKQLQFAAVSGAEVLARSKTPYPGCSLPWRVTVITAEGRSTSTPDPKLLEETEEAKKKKKRKGKKARIAIRQKLAVERERLDKEKTLAAEKELRDKMKKAKRNREKKFKKRARDKLKKLKEEGSGNEDDAESESSLEED
jgi:hypothetical protein